MVRTIYVLQATAFSSDPPINFLFGVFDISDKVLLRHSFGNLFLILLDVLLVVLEAVPYFPS